jgi:cystathionine gamma-synthase
MAGVEPVTRAVIPPIHLSTTFERAADGSFPDGRGYIRTDSPTVEHPERLLAALEGGETALVFSSGMAAGMTVFRTVLRPGDHAVIPEAMYYALRVGVLEWAARWGVEVDQVDMSDLEALGTILQAGRTRLVWVETPANPSWEVTDIAAVAGLAHRAGALVVADSTVATPVLTRPLELGADLVMHSATKYLNGHCDVLAGALVGRHGELWRHLADARRVDGAMPGPFDAFLLWRGMRTLSVRVRRQSATALAVARALDGHSRLVGVLYPGLESHPGHSVAARQMDGGFGGMLSIRVAGGEAAARAVAGRTRLWVQATSLGGTESLVEHRASVEDAATRVPVDLLRLSVGLEHPDDLIEDILAALDR